MTGLKLSTNTHLIFFTEDITKRSGSAIKCVLSSHLGLRADKINIRDRLTGKCHSKMVKCFSDNMENIGTLLQNLPFTSYNNNYKITKLSTCTNTLKHKVYVAE